MPIQTHKIAALRPEKSTCAQGSNTSRLTRNHPRACTFSQGQLAYSIVPCTYSTERELYSYSPSGEKERERAALFSNVPRRPIFVHGSAWHPADATGNGMVISLSWGQVATRILRMLRVS